MRRDDKIILASAAVWLVGFLVLRQILVVSGSEYPMLDAVTPNPRYDAGLSELLVWAAFGWTGICIALGILWVKATRDE
ncbi:MAG: hypothetical protein WBJ62_01485 [Coriobacteriia bacterium]